MDERLAFGLCPGGTFDFYASGSYREGVPRPEQVLGYPLGSWHTTYGRMEKYLTALSSAVPERVRVFDYGQSTERQVMHLVVIGSEANVRRLDAIRESLARLADPRRTAQAEAETIIADLPVVVWLNAANDGNETAAFEAAMQMAFQVAAGEDARTRGLRENALTIINLAHNPESHERMVAWYNAFVAGDPDPAALEHNAPWGMSTNNNHYQFDLNRDALALVQSETRAVAAELQRWRPQVFIDLHGETTQFFFPPAAEPVNPVYGDQMYRWLEVFGKANAAAFDAHGWSYYTRDIFDLYYPGYWDTYPGLHGATGMTYETDGGGSKGVRWRRDDGTILRFADGIARHYVAGLATVETAAKNRVERLRDYYRFFVAGVEKGRTSGLRTVVLLPGRDPNNTARLATTLLRHGIEVARVTQESAVLATDLLGGTRTRHSIPVGAYVIDMAQPNGLLAHTLLVPDVALPKVFANQELARFARNARRTPSERESYEFYDVTAWNVALAHGVSLLHSAEALPLASERLMLADSDTKSPGGWAGDVAWPRGGGATGRAQSAYVWEGGSGAAYRLLARLMGEGFSVVVAERPLVVDGRDFARGSFVVRVDRNPPELHDRIAALARDAGVSVHSARSAFPERGPTGTGSESTRTLNPPRVAVLAGEGVSITSFGALWFHLERRVGQPFTALRPDGVAAAAIDRFDVLVIPDGSYGDALDEDAAKTLKEWVGRGGALVAYGGGARWVLQHDLGTGHEKPDTTALSRDSLDAIVKRIDALIPSTTGLPPLTNAGARPHDAEAVPGAFLRVRLDPMHWLTAGYEAAEMAVLLQSTPLRPTTKGANPVVFADSSRLVIAGFVWPYNTARNYPNRPYATVDQVGEGKVILLAADPLYRGAFDAPGGLLMNAIYFGSRRRPGTK
jgi:hypothetical protein